MASASDAVARNSTRAPMAPTDLMRSVRSPLMLKAIPISPHAYLARDEGRCLEVEHRINDLARLAHSAHRLQAGETCASGACIGVLITPGETAFTRMPPRAERKSVVLSSGRMLVVFREPCN
jgi:hypothetical protein